MRAAHLIVGGHDALHTGAALNRTQRFEAADLQQQGSGLAALYNEQGVREETMVHNAGTLRALQMLISHEMGWSILDKQTAAQA